MNIRLTKSVLSAAIALTLTACGGGSDVAGIGGSGYISSGSVTGFGSVFVNGVEFETDSATFDVDGDSGTQDDLDIGMVVRVNGSINDDGVTGTASSISFDDQLQGPVSAVGVPDLDGIKRSFTVLGVVTVIVDSSSTTFDIDNDNVPANTIFDFNNISENNNVEVSGFFDTSGNIQATRVELKNSDFDSSSIVEVKGIISGLSGTTFNLANFGSLEIDASAATLDDLPNGLIDGQLVEVKGTLNTGLTTLIASKVEAEENSTDDTDEFELEGIITDYFGDNNFKIGGMTVDASNATKEPTSLVLIDDAHVEAEGSIVNGILIATEIQSEGGDLKVHATVTAVDVAANTFAVSPVSGGQAITITASTDTKFEDDVDEDKFFNVSRLEILDFVEVEGFNDGNNGITATEVKVKEASDVILQGFATAATGNSTGGSITILGVTFSFDGMTDFEDANDDDFVDGTQIDALISAIMTSPQLIKIKDNESAIGGNAIGIADEIDIE